MARRTVTIPTLRSAPNGRVATILSIKDDESGEWCGDRLATYRVDAAFAMDPSIKRKRRHQLRYYLVPSVVRTVLDTHPFCDREGEEC